MFSKRSAKYLILEDIVILRKPPRRWPTLTSVVLAVCAVAAFAAMQATHAAESARTQAPVTLTEVEAGQLLLSREPAGEYRAALSLASEVNFSITGMLAQVSVKQSFINDSDGWLEGVYVFPLPAEAALNALQIRIGERLINGEIHEQQQAAKIYQQAKNDGYKAALVEQQRPNLFTSAIANIAPGETVTVEIKYLQTVDYNVGESSAGNSGEFSLRFPMTITPRYIPGQPLAADQRELTLSPGDGFGWASNSDQVSDAARVTPPLQPASDVAQQHSIRITGSIDMGLPLHGVESAYHDISVASSDDLYTFDLAEGSVPMTQDFVLSWQPQADLAPQAALFTEKLNGEDYALLMLVPPQQPNYASIAKQQTYIIDTSGSMGGVPIRQAKQSLLLALDQLQAQDRFNIIEFNDSTRAFFSQALPATPANIDRAKRGVQRLRAQGGTEMLAALHAALESPDDDGHLQQIIFITDGAVGNEAALFKLIQQRLGASRLFTVGIGAAPNSYFMRKAAQFGRGSFTYIGDINEVGVQMTDLFAKLNSPVLRQLSVEWPAGIQAENYPQRMPDLYRGEPLLLSTRLNAMPDSVTVSGTSAGEKWQRTLSVNGGGSEADKGIATLWARQKISSLMDEIITGRAEQEVRAAVLPLALSHKVVSPYTSFVAVENSVSRTNAEQLESIPVPNAQPHGQSLQTYAYPQTATHAAQSIVWGLLLLAFGVIIYVCIRQEEQNALQA